MSSLFSTLDESGLGFISPDQCQHAMRLCGFDNFTLPSFSKLSVSKSDFVRMASEEFSNTDSKCSTDHNFQGIQAGRDGSAHQQRMGAGVWCRHVHDQEWSIRVGRESEGTNSKRPELAAVVSVLRAVHVRSLLLYLCDNEAVLLDIAKWIGEGHKQDVHGTQQRCRHHE